MSNRSDRWRDSGSEDSMTEEEAKLAAEIEATPLDRLHYEVIPT